MRRRGLTMVEAAIAVLLLFLLLAAISQTVRLHRLADEGVGRLDMLQHLRLAERRLGAELARGTAVLFPPISSPGGAGQLVFTGPVNELAMVFLDRDGRLTLLVRGKPPEVLAEGITALRAEQPRRGLVRCIIQVRSPETGNIETVVAAQLGNHFHGERNAP